MGRKWKDNEEKNKKIIKKIKERIKGENKNRNIKNDYTLVTNTIHPSIVEKTRK